MTRRDDKAPATKPDTETTTDPINPDTDTGKIIESAVTQQVSREERAALMEARNNGPVAYTTDAIAASLITKGLAAAASVDPAPGEGHKAISLTLAGKSWAARNADDA